MVPNYGRRPLDPDTIYRNRQSIPHRYLVGWPSHDIVKVGVTSGYGKRWHRLTVRGAQVLDLAAYTNVIDAEERLQASLALMFPNAFNSCAEATHILGPGGSGYTECFDIPVEAWPTVVHIAQEDRL